MSKLIDLSHSISNGMITYRGLPAPVITDFLSREASRSHYASGTEFQIGRIEMVGNTGTYLDTPFHRYSNGLDLAQIPLESVADLKGVVVRMVDSGLPPIAKGIFKDTDVTGRAVLIHTGWARHFGTETYFSNHPFLTKDAAEFLAQSGAALVGIDSYNIDHTADATRPAHSILLGAGIPIVEHLHRLEQLPDHDFRFFAVPAPVRQFGTFPVRAFAIVSR